MVRGYTQEHTYQHPWSRVTAAAFRKFTDPSTPAVLTHILDVHTLSRRLVAGPSASTSSPAPTLHVTRSITVRSPPLPFILRRLLGHDSLLCHCVESTVVDPASRSMDVVTRNASLRSLIEVEERSSYRPDPRNPDEWTVLKQETRIRCKPLSALAAVAEKVEHRCAERFLLNSAKGREVVERICGYLEKESSPSASASAASAC